MQWHVAQSLILPRWWLLGCLSYILAPFARPTNVLWFLVFVGLASGMDVARGLRWYLDFWSLLNWLRGCIYQGVSCDIWMFCLCWIGFGFEFAKESHVPSWFLISIVLVSGLDLPRVFKWHLDVWSRVSNGILDIFSRCCLLIIRRWGVNPGSFSCFLNWGKGGYWARTTKRLNYGCNCWHILCISARHSRRAFPIGLRWRPPWNQRSRIS